MKIHIVLVIILIVVIISYFIIPQIKNTEEKTHSGQAKNCFLKYFVLIESKEQEERSDLEGVYSNLIAPCSLFYYIKCNSII